MVVDSLENCRQYFSLHPDFKRAFEFLQSLTLDDVKPQTYEIEGDRLFATISRNALRSADAAHLEVHRRYIDIQYVIRGREGYGHSPLQHCHQEREPYDENRDIAFFDDRWESLVHLSDGQFAIFFPEDAHAPLLGEGQVIKCILKIAVE